MTPVRLALLLSVILLGGCERADLSDLERFVAETRAQAKGKVEPLPDIPPPPVHQYQPNGLRDPFQPPRARLMAARPRGEAGAGPRPDQDRPREPPEH